MKSFPRNAIVVLAVLLVIDIIGIKTMNRSPILTAACVIADSSFFDK